MFVPEPSQAVYSHLADAARWLSRSQHQAMEGGREHFARLVLQETLESVDTIGDVDENLKESLLALHTDGILDAVKAAAMIRGHTTNHDRAAHALVANMGNLDVLYRTLTKDDNLANGVEARNRLYGLHHEGRLPNMPCTSISHLVRAAGYRRLAVLDRPTLFEMQAAGLTGTVRQNGIVTVRRYQRVENQFIQWADRLGIGPDVLNCAISAARKIRACTLPRS